MIQANHIAFLLPTFPDPIRDMVEDVVAFAKANENGHVLDGWSDESLRVLVAFHFAKKTLIVHRDQKGAIDGIFMWYKFKDPWGWERIYEWAPDDEQWDNCFMGFVYALSSKAFAEITIEFIAREPDIMWKKLSGIRRGKRVTYTQKLLARIIKNGR